MNIFNNVRYSQYLVKLYYRPLFRKALLPFIKEPYEKRYIFVVGCYNSGTTLLNDILSCHEEISGLPSEGMALTSELKRPEDFGWNRMWHICRDRLEISRLAEKPDPEKLKKEWSFWFDRNKEFWMEKSIINSLNIDWFEEYFNHPYFIWIIRNGYAVAEGIRRRTRPEGKHHAQYTGGYPIRLCAKQWVENNRVIEEKLKGAKNSTKLTYEDLTLNPDAAVRNILEWLPVKNKSITLPEVFTFHKDSARISNMNQESINRLTAEEINIINEEAEDVLKRCGYEVIS